MAPEKLVHGKHVDLVLLENGVQLLVAEDVALVVGVLQPVSLDVFPELLDDLRAGQLKTWSVFGLFTPNGGWDGCTYLVLPAEFGQRKTQVKRFLEAAPCLALRLGAGVGAGVAVVVGAHPLRALLLGGLGPRLGLGHAGTARHAAARETVLLCLELGGQAGVGILARALPLLFLGGWRQRDLDLAVGASVVVRGRVAVCVVLGGGARGGRGDLGDLGGRDGVKAGFYQVLDGNLFGGTKAGQ